MNDSPQSEPTLLPSPQEGIADRIRLLKEAGDLDGAIALYREEERGYRQSNNLTELKENLKSQGDLLRERGDWAGSMQFLLEAEKICRELGDSNRLQAVLNNQGLSLDMSGDLDGAARQFRESEQICRGLLDLNGVCRCLHNRALVLTDQGDLEGALALYQEEEQIWRGMENLDELQRCLNRQAGILEKRNDLDKALAMHKEREQILRKLENLNGLQRCLGKQAAIQKNLNDLNGALPLYKEQEQLCRQLADREGLLWCLGNQTFILANLHDLSGALAMCNEQEQLCRELEDPGTLQLCLRNHAILLRDLNEKTNALVFYREQEQICRQLGDLDSLLNCLGDQTAILEEQNDLHCASALYAEQEQLCRQLENSNRLRWCLKHHALLLKKRDDLEGALALFHEEEQICRQRDNLDDLQICLGNQALVLKKGDNLDGALALLKEKEQICRDLGNLNSSQWSLKNQALILRKRNDLDGALALHKEEEIICRQLGDLDDLQICLSNQAFILDQRGDLDGAVALYTEQEQICRQGGIQRGLQWGLKNHALILQKRNDLDNAMALYKEEVQICRELDELNDVEVSLGNQASILEKRNDLDGALTLYKEQEQVCRQLGSLDHLQRCLGSQAFILRKKNDLDGALVALREKNHICRQLGKTSGLVWCLGQEAIILKNRNELDGALALFKEEEQICRQINNLTDLQSALGNQGMILRNRNDLDAALALFNEQEQICRKIKNEDGLQWCLGNQALILEKRDDLDGALSRHKEEERICRQLGKLDDLQICLGNQALILKRRGDTDGSLELFREKGEICRQLGKLGGVQWSLKNRALILEQRNELDRALVLLREEEQICRQLNKPDLLRANLDRQAKILKVQKELSEAFSSNTGPRPDSGAAANISKMRDPIEARRQDLAAAIRPYWVAVIYLTAILIVIPACITLCSFLLGLLPLVFLWFLADRLWRMLRNIWRSVNTRRFRHIATQLTSQVMSKRRSISAASRLFSERPFRYIRVHYLISSLITTVHAMRSANQSEAAVISCRLVLALADKHGEKEDKKKCRRLLVECLSSNEISSQIREDCENLLQQDQSRSPQLFAASQIERAEILAKLTTDREHLQEIEALKAAESCLTQDDDLEQWADAKNLLSVAFWKRWQAGKDSADLDLAIKHGTKCLQVLNEYDQPTRWALAHYNLGVFYAARTSDCPQDDIELTIKSMECALRVYTPGFPNYVNAQMRLMAALSKRLKGIETLNLDRGISCINAAFTDPHLTDAQRESLQTSLKVLMQRRWGPAVSSLTEARHIEAKKHFTDNAPDIPILALRSIVGSGEPFDRKRRTLARLRWLTILLDIVSAFVLWHKPWALTGSLLAINLAYICFAASLATEGLEKLTMLPLDWVRITPAFVWWGLTSKDRNKMRMIGAMLSFGSDPELATRKLEEMWKVIHKESHPTVWAIVGSIYAWLCLSFPQGEAGESIHNAIAILQDAGAQFTKKRFGVFQSGVDLSLAKAYLLSAQTGGQGTPQDAIDLITTHIMPTRLTGSQKRHGFIWGQGLQLLGDAYMMLAAKDSQHWARLAIQCYVESLSSRALSQSQSFQVTREVLSIARMRSTRAMRAHALKGIGNCLLRLPDDADYDRRSLAIACLVNAYRILDRPGILRQIRELSAPKDMSLVRLESLQAAETKLEILIMSARALSFTTPTSEPQLDLAEGILRVCTSDALRFGFNAIAYTALMELGTLLSKEGRLTEAVGAYDLAIRHIEASRAVARLMERKAEILRYSTEPFDRIIITLVRLGRYNDACEYVERSKSLGISDLVSLGRALGEENHESTVKDFTELQLKATLLSHELTHIVQLPGKTRTATGTWNRQYITSQRQKFYKTTETLLQFAESSADSNFGLNVETKPFGTNAIQELGRKAKTAFVLFRVTKEATYAFVLTPHKHRVVQSDRLTRMELDNALGLAGSSKPAKWWFGMDNLRSWRSEMDEMLHTLGDAMMRKITAVLREQRSIEGPQSFDRVVLLPSRALSIVPLHACWWDGDNGREYLLDEFPVNYSPSISIYKQCLERTCVLTDETRFVGVFNPSPPGDLQFASWEHFAMGPVLTGWDSDRYLEQAATREVLSKAWRNSNVLHFSCHGQYQLDAPFQSHLVLAGKDNFTLQQILQGPRLESAQLVVLSACESGLADPRDAADEHYGLPTAFIFAGAPTIWATLWSVDDVATALLTVRAYENLRNGQVDKSEALRSAQLWLRDATAAELKESLSRRDEGIYNDPSVSSRVAEKMKDWEADSDGRPYKHPDYWAAFHTVGA
jgi:CHAT domain-containing protein